KKRDTFRCLFCFFLLRLRETARKVQIKINVEAGTLLTSQAKLYSIFLLSQSNNVILLQQHLVLLLGTGSTPHSERILPAVNQLREQSYREPSLLSHCSIFENPT